MPTAGQALPSAEHCWPLSAAVTGWTPGRFHALAQTVCASQSMTAEVANIHVHLGQGFVCGPAGDRKLHRSRGPRIGQSHPLSADLDRDAACPTTPPYSKAINRASTAHESSASRSTVAEHATQREFVRKLHRFAQACSPAIRKCAASHPKCKVRFPIPP